MTRAPWIAVAAATLAIGGTLLARSRLRPDGTLPPGGDSPTRGDDSQLTRRLAEENFALRREAEELRQALDDTPAPVVSGLPAPPAAVTSPDEMRVMDEIGKRVTDELRPKLGQLYHELTGADPATDTTFETLFGALLEAAGIADYDALFAEVTALRSVYRRHAAPPPNASPSQRILWLLQDADESMEHELKEALPAERVEEFQKQRSGFGFSIRRRNGRWVVTQSRPHA